MDNQWDTYASLYNQGIGESGDALHQKCIDPVIFQLFNDWKDKIVLDAGCGNGYLVSKLSLLVKQIIGIDSSQKLLTYAKEGNKQQNTSFLLADITQKTSFSDNYFDVIIANMLVQYLPTLESFTQECKRIIKPNGKLIMILDHPAHALFLRAQELIGKKNDKFLTSGSYFKAELRTKKSLWDKAILHYYHRPIKDYMNTFTPYFCLEKMEENTEDGEMPRMLGLLWSKK